MAKKYVLKLTGEEQSELERLVRKGHVAGWRVQRAQALLEFDQGPDGPAWVERGPLSLLEAIRKAMRP